MSSIGGANIVTNGLVLALDAANRNSYISGSTIWRDMSGNLIGGNIITGSLINSPTFSSASYGTIVFDGVDDYIRFSSILIPQTGNWTHSSFFKLNELVQGSVIYGQYIQDGNNGRFIIRLSDPVANNNKFSLFLGSGVAYENEFIYTSQTAEIGVVYNLVVARNGQSYTIYVNGYSDVTTTTNFTASLLQTTPLIGGRSISAVSSTPASDEFLNGEMYLTLIYNRALTSQEVLQNYNALKGRFGLD